MSENTEGRAGEGTGADVAGVGGAGDRPGKSGVEAGGVHRNPAEIVTGGDSSDSGVLAAGSVDRNSAEIATGGDSSDSGVLAAGNATRNPAEIVTGGTDRGVEEIAAGSGMGEGAGRRIAGMLDWRRVFINPVLGKEITLRMRTARSMWALLFYLIAIGIGALGFLYVTQMNNSQNVFNPDASRMMFIFISMAQLGLIAFMAPGLTAGIVSGERERQTLNLLLTTQQSSSAIILSKLAAALAFMVLIVVATMPVYSIVFLYGGISPSQLAMVFLFYLFVMLAFGAFGILFSTLFKRTMLSVIVTYGVMLFSFGGTAFLYLILNSIMQNAYRGTSVNYGWIGHLMGLNPVAAMYSLFDPGFSRSVFRSFAAIGGTGGTQGAPIQLWAEFLIVYSVLTVLAVVVSIRRIRPRLKRGRPAK